MLGLILNNYICKTTYRKLMILPTVQNCDFVRIQPIITTVFTLNTIYRKNIYINAQVPLKFNGIDNKNNKTSCRNVKSQIERTNVNFRRCCRLV